MSCFQVSKPHVAALLRFWRSTFRGSNSVRVYPQGEAVVFGDSLDSQTWLAVGECLWDANALSVNERYHTTSAQEETDAFTVADLPSLHSPRCSPVEVLKLISCLDYQSCDWSGWLSSAAHSVLLNIEAAAIHALPGYDAAPWTLDTTSPTHA